MSELTDIADAVKTEINAATFSLSFDDAERRWRPYNDPEELQTLTISVVPAAVSNAAMSRSEDLVAYTVHILIQCRLDNEKNATIDPYDDLAEEFMDFFRLREIESVGAWVDDVSRPVVMSTEHWDMFRVFTSYVQLDVVKERGPA